MKDKCIILVSHQVHLLKSANQILVMKNGEVIEKGTFPQLCESGSMKVENEIPSFEVDVYETSLEPETTQKCLENNELITESLEKNTKTMSTPVEEAEHRTKGLLETNIYWKYFRAGNSWILLWTFFIFIWLTQLSLSGSDYWLKVWYVESVIY